MTTPIPPSRTPSTGSSGPELPNEPPSLYAFIRSQITDQSTKAKELVRIIKAKHIDLAGTEEQTAALKAAVINYAYSLLEESDQVGDLIKEAQNAALILIGPDFRKEYLPEFFAFLLSQLYVNKTDFFETIAPYSDNKQITLNLKNPADEKVYYQLQNAYYQLQKRFSFLPVNTYRQVSFKDIKNSFDTNEEYQNFLIDWYRRTIDFAPRKFESLLSLVGYPISPSSHVKSPPPSLLITLIDFAAPKLIEKAVEMLKKDNLSAIVDHSAHAIKSHLDNVQKIEEKIEGLKSEIAWVKDGLISGYIKSDPSLEKFAKSVWGQNLFSVESLDRRAKFLEKEMSKTREAHYIEEARYTLLGVKPIYDTDLLELQKALFEENQIPTPKLDSISNHLWGVGFRELYNKSSFDKRYYIAVSAYKKGLQKEMAIKTGEVLGNHLSAILTPDFIKDTLITASKTEKWKKLETEHPILLQLKNQLTKDSVTDEDVVNFLPFIEKGLPSLLKGFISWSLETKMVRDLLSPSGFNQLLQNTLLPAVVENIHGMIITDIIQKHRHTLIDTLVDENHTNELIFQVTTDYESLLRDESIEQPLNVDITRTIEGTIRNLKRQMKELYEQNFDEDVLRQAIIEYLEPLNAPLSSGENVPVYPELILSVLSSFLELPSFLKKALNTPYLAPKISLAVTSAIAPYREGGGELIRTLTSIFQELLVPRPSSSTVKPAPRSIEEQVKAISKIATVLTRQKLGVSKGLSRHTFNLLQPEFWIEFLVRKTLHHPLVATPLHFHRFTILLMGGQKNE